MTNCDRAKLHSGDVAGLCLNCGQPVLMASTGVRMRSSRYGLTHVLTDDPRYIRAMAQQAAIAKRYGR